MDKNKVENDKSGSKTLRDLLNKLRSENEAEVIQPLYDVMITNRKIRQVSERFFKRGEYRTAVLDAMIALEVMVKEKAGYPSVRGKELSGASLMRHVFDKNDPILFWRPLVTQADKDELEGYQHLMAGAMMGIRNPKAHRIYQQTPRRALELLVVANLFAELVEASKNLKAP